MTDLTNLEQQFQNWDDPATPPTRTTPAKIPTGQLLTSLVGVGPIPFTKVVKTHTIVGESNRLAGPAGAEELTLAETVTRAPVVARAIKGLEKTLKNTIEPQIDALKKTYARINLLGEMITEAQKSPLVGAGGEQLTVEEAQHAHDTLRDKATRETNAGSKEHHIRRQRSTKKEIGLLLLDFPVFFLAMTGLLNVSFRLLFVGDGPTTIMAVTAAVFALLGTLLFAVLMRAMGRRHRRFKGADSTIDATGIARRRIMIEQIVTVTITVAAALVMGLRIYTEGIDAGSNIALIVILAILFAVLVGVSGYVNYMSEYENGSETSDRIQHLSSQLFRHQSNLTSLTKQRSILIEDAGIKVASLLRTIAKANEHATHQVLTSSADKAIAIARSYCASITSLPVPELTSRAITVIESQAQELAEHHKTLNPTTKSTITDEEN